MLATSVDPKPVAPTYTAAEKRALLSDPLSTFAYAFEAKTGEGSRSLIRAAYHAKDLGLGYDDVVELMYEINSYWDVPLDQKRFDSTILTQIKRMFS